jgi:malate synthase
MTTHIERAGLFVAEPLVRFLEEHALHGTGIDTERFWSGVTNIYSAFADENMALLTVRDEMQTKIDAWHRSHAGMAFNVEAYADFLLEIGYLEPEPGPFKIGVAGVDAELTSVGGPQLVAPVLNARFLLNAANARWGSLYDALYGSDAIDNPIDAKGYDSNRGAKVIEFAKAFLDRATPLSEGTHAAVAGYRVDGDALSPALADPTVFAGYRGAPSAPTAILFRHHGLHIQLEIDRSHPVGKSDPAGVADIILEAALTTIVDFEDSIAAVDADDKVAAYTNFLGLIRGSLTAQFDKDGRSVVRTLAPDRCYTSPTGETLTLPGRSLLLVRNVGLHIMTDAVRQHDGKETPEGILDGIVTSLIFLHGLERPVDDASGRAGSIYIVKPKLHGPQEVAFTSRLFDAIEDLLGLARHTIKIGVMDEERRTSANLEGCIRAVKDRIIFINTGFLDRTGDEIHTSMAAGPMVRKDEMKKAGWLRAYEDRNVHIGLASGFSGNAQIGKGMWAMPDRMNDMLKQKGAHPRAGANTAWVPSPTAATLHAMHYHEIDVFLRQKALEKDLLPDRKELLHIPLADPRALSQAEIREELDSNAQSILGYVVRWIDQGIGCSKVPDIHDISLMEDRATLRISSQLLANWLEHGVCSAADLNASLQRMAAKVDAQNAANPAYRPMSGRESESLAFQASRALVFEGVHQSNGYTEMLLHHFRKKAKRQ